MNAFRIRLAGDVDIAYENDLAALGEAFASDPARDAEVDLSEVTFMDSAGLALLVPLQQEAARRGGTVTLLDPPSTCVKVLEIYRLCDRFTVSQRGKP